jgi:hypothetical protein
MKWRESVLVLVMLLGASVAGAFAPEPRRHGVVAKFHAHAAGCHVAGSSRPVSLTVVCS